MELFSLYHIYQLIKSSAQPNMYIPHEEPKQKKDKQHVEEAEKDESYAA